jgi:CRP-like cAMP-binding protein
MTFQAPSQTAQTPSPSQRIFEPAITSFASRMRNRALASLTDDEFEFLRPNLRSRTLSRDELIDRQGDRVSTVHFPLSGMVSIIINLDDGRAVEAAMTGPEGVLGVGSLGSGTASGDHLVQGDGEALTIQRDHLLSAMYQSPGITRMVCAAAEISNAYTLQSLACINFHPLEARFCRWLLMARYHTGSDELQLTQEFLAMMLGAQRTSVTTVAKKFQDSGVVSYHRGRMTILDVASLEACSCGCHQHVTERIEEAFPRASS